ncbi:MAG: hypothetical protein CFE43_18900 [Burkholderiales bacterium PBB3]|nr:MAG: hypothetical protein CFE43_18900 [Burkholderiales bacterium PBB3]
MSTLETSAALPTTGPRQLLLLGAGPAHRQVLAWLAQHPLAGVQITLITPHNTQWHPALLPAFVAGRASAQDCQIALEPLVQRSGVQWLCANVRALDASHRSLSLDDGSTRVFDWMSIDTEALQNREQLEQSLPGAREHALFVSPLAAFGALWPQVCSLAEKRALRFTVVGAGATGTELALALQARFPSHSTTLLTGTSPPCATYPLAVQARVLHTLKQRKVTVLQDTALEISDQAVQLACGAALASDVTLLATPAQAPRWAHNSGLAQCAQRLIAVDEHQRSFSHPWVFAVGEISSRQPAAPRPRGTAESAQAGEDLAQRLAAAVADQPLPQARLRSGAAAWSLLDLGQGHALASQGSWTVQGRWVGWIKSWLDQKHVASWR